MMKVIFQILVAVTVAFCQAPPPYAQSGIRPNPPFILPNRLSVNRIPQPQTVYGVPNSTPSKVIRPLSPQIQYVAPNLTPNFSSKQTIPRTSYGVPVTEGSGSLKSIRIINNQPQKTFRPLYRPSTLNSPQTQYGVPNINNVETLEQIREINLLSNLLLQSREQQALQKNQLLSNQNLNNNIIPSVQYLPQKEAVDFQTGLSQSAYTNPQSQNSNRNVQQPLSEYLPSREVLNFQVTAPNLPSSNQIGQQQSFHQNLPVKEPVSFKINVGLLEPDSRKTTSQDFSNFRPRTEPQNHLQPINNVPSTQYVPSAAENIQGQQPSSFINNGQQVPQRHFNQQQSPRQSPNTNMANRQLSNSNANNFRRPNPPTNFDIQPADVRQLSGAGRDTDGNKFQPVSNSRPDTKLNQGFKENRAEALKSDRPDEVYLPPSTTVRPINRPTNRPGNGPNFVPATTEATGGDTDGTSDSTEGPGGPNIAIATAVSGVPGGQGVYLLQPDGRLQRVVYQRTQAPSDQENEYTANYLFQTIQRDPNLVYSPLVAVGK